MLLWPLHRNTSPKRTSDRVTTAFELSVIVIAPWSPASNGPTPSTAHDPVASAVPLKVFPPTATVTAPAVAPAPQSETGFPRWSTMPSPSAFDTRKADGAGAAATNAVIMQVANMVPFVVKIQVYGDSQFQNRRHL
eukprot:m.65756 g.65756  ORF g.65756 m.65756 type:complete len:136 (+) comp9781_c0_seq1:1267-1674(+)